PGRHVQPPGPPPAGRGSPMTTLAYTSGLPGEIWDHPAILARARGKSTLRAVLEVVLSYCRRFRTDAVFVSYRTIAADGGIDLGHLSGRVRWLRAQDRLAVEADDTSPNGRTIVLKWYQPPEPRPAAPPCGAGAKALRVAPAPRPLRVAPAPRGESGGERNPTA